MTPLPELVQSLLDPQAYLNNKKRFEPVAVDDLKSSYPSLDVIHLIVDT